MSFILGRLGRALEQLLYSPEEIAWKRIQYIKDHKELRFIKRIELDLGDARDREEHTVAGDVLLAESITGEVDIYFNDDDVNFIELDKTSKMYMDFWRIFITNSAQAGKSCVILIGHQGIFDGVADVARESTQNALIALVATESKQDDTITAVGEIKVGTDKIIADGATEAKQDLAYTRQNLQATAAKQDLQATATKQDLQATSAKQDLAYARQNLQATASKQNDMKTEIEYVKVATESLLEYDEELHEYDPTVIIDDGGVAFWTVSEGAHVTESDDILIVKKGNNSYKLVGDGSRALTRLVEHNYGAGQDWSGRKHLSFRMYGENNGLTYQLFVANETGAAPTNYYRWNFVDDFVGWKKFNPLISEPTVKVGSFDITSVLCVQFRENSKSAFTVRFDRFIIDNMKPRLDGTIAKLIEQKDILDGAATKTKQDTMESTLNAIEALSGMNYRPSDDVLLTSVAAVDKANDTVYTKAKEVLITANGYYRWTVEGKCTVGGDCIVKMYKDGAEYGTERTTGDVQVYTEVALDDLWYNIGELAQLYYKTVVGESAFVQNLKMRGTLAVLGGIEQ